MIILMGFLQYCDKLCNKDDKSAIFHCFSRSFTLPELTDIDFDWRSFSRLRKQFANVEISQRFQKVPRIFIAYFSPVWLQESSSSLSSPVAIVPPA